MEVQFGDTVLELPDGATPEQIKSAVAGFRKTPQFDQMIDKTTGASIDARANVGGGPDKDRLASIRQTYPDAQPHGDDNFVFTNPDTGKITLYNPSGLDVGDVASVGREIAMTAGGAVGAAASGVPTLGVGSAVGAGLGAAAGGQAFDLVREYIAGGANTQTGGERATGAFIDFGGTAIGQKLGEVVPAAGKAALGGLGAKAQKVVNAFRALKIDPPGGATTGSRALATVESMLESTPASSDIMQANAEKVISQTGKAARELAKKFGTPRSDTGLGSAIQKAAEGAKERFGVKNEALYDAAYDLVGPERLVQIGAVRQLKGELQVILGRAPASMKSALSSTMEKIAALEDDAANGGIPFAGLRAIRSSVGHEMGAPSMTRADAATRGSLKRLYGAISEDLSGAVHASSAKGGKLLNQADRSFKAWKNGTEKLLDKVVKFDSDERAYRFLKTASKDDSKALAKLRAQFEPEEWDEVAASVLANMGRSKTGAQGAAQDSFSVSSFLTEYSKIAEHGPRAMKTLFSGKRYAGLQKELDNLVTAVGSLKGAQSVANSSNTGRTMIAYTMMQTLVGGMLGTAAGGDTQSGLAGAGAAILAPRLAAKLITSPKFLKWVTTPITSPNAVGPHIGRLAAIAKANPELEEAISQYTEALKGEK